MTTYRGSTTISKDLIYIVTEDNRLTSELCIYIDPRKYCVENHQNFQSFESACRAKKPAVILFDVDSSESGKISECILNLQEGVAHQPPVIAIGNSNQIEQRLHAVHCSASRYMSALQESQSRQEVIDRHAIVSITDTHGDIIYVNKKPCEVSGYETDEQIGKNRRMHSSGRHPRSFYDEMWASLKTGIYRCPLSSVP